MAKKRITGWRYKGKKGKNKKGEPLGNAPSGLPPRDIGYPEAVYQNWLDLLNRPGMNRYYKIERSKGE